MSGQLWAFLGFIGGLILLGMAVNVVLLLDIKANIDVKKRSRRRPGPDDE